MEKIIYKAILLLMLVLDSSTFCLAKEKPVRHGHSNCKIVTNESTRGSPTDSTKYSIKINGHSNSVIINDKLITTNSDSTNNQNYILVGGEENRI